MIAISKKLNYKFGILQGANNLGSYYLNRNELDSALYYREATLNLAKEINSLMGILTANTQMGVLFTNMNDYNKAKEYLNENIELYKKRDSIPNVKENDFRYIGSTYNQLAEINVKQGQYNIALKNQLHALKLYKETGEELFIADAHTALGRIENHLGNYSKSNGYLENALATYTKFDDLLWECEVRLNLGENFIHQEHPLKALEHFKRVTEIASENDFKLLEARAYNSLGKTYTEITQYETALRHLKKALSLFKSNHPSEISDTYNNLGVLHTKMGKSKEGVSFLDKAISILDSINAKGQLAKAYLNRSYAKELLDDPSAALSDFKEYNTLNDSIFNRVKSQQIEELRIIYDTEKKEQEIAILEQKAEINNLQKLMLGLGLGLSLLVFGIGFYALRQKMKRNKLEKERVDAELAFKKKELTTHALHLAKKNETLESLRQKAEELKSNENGQNITQLINTINFDLQDDNNWENFARYFEEVHKDFNVTVAKKYPEITPNELRLMALIKMNLSSKEIANILNISIPGIKKARQRLRKKMNLSTSDSLENAVLNI
ncbi:transcriptional regulator [Flagellimonas meishanensis]|uniref:transcriptional regulator n=1 Tax=Flagellimonas meishanensis TaxID=2873264 RepID=UPI001CA6A605|nr:transcriptional regulator [[Muricauda] meishanensis]